MRPKGVLVAERQVKIPSIIIGDEDTVSNDDGMEAAAAILEEVHWV